VATVAATGERRPGAVRGLVLSLRPIAGLLRPYRIWVVGAALLNLGVHLLTLASIVAGSVLVGRALSGATTSELMPLVWVVIGLVMPIALVGWLEVVVAHVLSFRLLNDLRKTLYERFRQLAPAYFLRRRSGDIARVAMADAEILEIFTSHLAPPLLVAFVVPVVALVGLFVLDPWLGVAALPFVAAAATVPSWLLRRAQDQGARLRDELGELGGDVVDIAQGTREVLTAGAADRMIGRIGAKHRTILGVSVANGWRSGFEQAAADGLAALAVVAVVVTAALLEIHGGIPASDLPVATILAVGAFLPLTALTSVMRDVGQVAAAADRVHELLAAEPQVRDLVADTTRHAPVPRVEFRSVRFGYAPELPEVLHGVDLAIEPGETLALVGRSGAGKSTCASLLLRLWDITDGRVAIGGVDVRDMTQRELRSMMAVVPQDVYLFHTSVMENVRLGRPDATDDDVRAAGELALATEFVEALPDGWHTVVGERGSTLSGGQRQRLAIARALLRDAPILVMDEAVGNLDAESEQAIQEGLVRAASRPTTLLIAHRPSTIRIADRVAVLEGGRVVEVGPYEELRSRDGVMSRLLASPGGIIDPDDEESTDPIDV
jgi:ABC-type multidrug transport system fused ATPase/permease subunit